MKKLILISLVIFAGIACNPRPEQVASTPTEEVKLTHRPKNVILMIGDGMGLTQISAALYSNGNKLNLEQFTYTGLHKSYAANDLITDSAAGATAFASGIKTYNGAIGVNTDTMPSQTILEEAENKGMAAGMVVTCSITHATPGAFVAHQKSREMMEAIASDLVKSKIDFFVGGGKKYFDQRQSDQRNLNAELESKGYQISDASMQNIQNISIDVNKRFGYFTADGEPVPYSEGRDYLVPATKKALDYLNKRSTKGFFLMVEGSQIDWGGHSNNSDYIISEALDFDRAIGAVLDFAKQDGETLVIVTADHETGGYAINIGSEMNHIVGTFTTKGHTPALIPVFAYGPGAELFSGIFENTAIYDKMAYALGFKNTGKVMSGGASRTK